MPFCHSRYALSAIASYMPLCHTLHCQQRGATMAKATIEYLNARKELRKGSDHSKKRAVKYCPDNQLDCWEQLELKIESSWADLRINSQAYWDKLFAQFGLQQGLAIDETF